MKTLSDWVTLPQAAERWGVTRAWVWRLVSEQMADLPAEVVVRDGDRWRLDLEFVTEVEKRVKEGSEVLAAIQAVVGALGE